MLVDRSLDAFRAEPSGGYVAGRQWLYFATSPDVFGYALWGKPSPDDLRALVHVLELELDRDRHAALVDVSGVEAMGCDSFDVLASYVTRHAARLAGIVTHTAMVRAPLGLNAAIASGFFAIVPPPFPVSFWDDLPAAFARVGQCDPADAAVTLRAATETAGAVPSLLRTLRQYLVEHPTAHSLARAARALGIGRRTLQRRLGEYGTSFLEEAQEMRLVAAERWLLETDAPVTRIATEVGCASSQHFSELFRRRRGESPSAYRNRRRAG